MPYKLTGFIKYDFREFVEVAYDGSGWIDIGEVDSGQYPLALDITWLNDNGLIDVTIEVDNERSMATAWLDHSRLYGTAQVCPNGVIPEPLTVGMTGLAVAAVGWYVRRRRRM